MFWSRGVRRGVASRFGDLGRLKPVSRVWGFDRGLPIDRYYIEKFLQRNSDAITGRVLEFGNDAYTRQFGVGVRSSDVWNAVAGDPRTTIVGDLTKAESVPDDRFDCVICTQTLQFIYDVRSAITTIFRILRPNGKALITLPGISQISRYDMDRWGDYWRPTREGLRRLFAGAFSAENVTVESHGNVLSSTAFLYGLSRSELLQEELDFRDARFELLLTTVAAKAGV